MITHDIFYMAKHGIILDNIKHEREYRIKFLTEFFETSMCLLTTTFSEFKPMQQPMPISPIEAFMQRH